ncbi:hypothetical protein [Brevibacillus marinus]|uniref:hypothetical protein n=1 Tax=Brevibacillus marinus TaxID=2496837 RepID=UPI000F83051C|nr:hypothetical protein [Brevibacillus marinus]
MEELNLISYLESMVGKVLRIFKAGAESKTARLIAVKDQYMVVDAEREGIVYYSLAHLRSICEELDLVYPQSSKPEDYYDNLHDALDLREVLERLKYETIWYCMSGAIGRQFGKILAVRSDFFALLTSEQEVLYGKIDQLVSFGKLIVSDVSDAYPQTVGAPVFAELLEYLQYRWVAIDCGEAETVEGVLVGICDDHLLLVCHKAVYRLAIWQIRAITTTDENGNGEYGVEEL